MSGPAYPPGAEPTEVIEARVRRRLLFLAAAAIAMALFYVIGNYSARSRVTRIEETLPPGITLETRLGKADTDPTLGERLNEVGAHLENGMLLDRENVPIRFAPEGYVDPEAGPGKMDVQSRYRVITIPQFDFERASGSH